MDNPEGTKPENDPPTQNQDNSKMSRNNRRSHSDLEQTLPYETPERDVPDHHTDTPTEQRPNRLTMETIHEMIEWELTEPEQGEANDSNNMNTTQDQDTQEESHHHDLRKKPRTNREQGPTKKPKKKKEKDKNQGLRKTRQTKRATQETDLQKIIDNIQGENKRNNDKLDEITQKLSTTKAQLENKKKENRKLKQEIEKLKTEKRDAHREIDEPRKELNDIKDENRTVRASNQDLAQQIVEYTSERPEPTTTERNIKLIGDSNMIILHGYLEMDLVTQIPLTKTFTLENAIELAENMDTQDKDSIHLIMVGTNNIKRGETAQQCATKHLRMTNILDRNNIQYNILQIPPSYRNIGRDTNFCNRETIKFNYKLVEKHDTISMEPLETDRSMIAHDGIHLTDNACIILGPEIIEKCRNINKYPERQATKTETSVIVTVNNDPAEHQDPTPRTTQPTDTVSEIFNTDKIRAGRIIGKKATNILNIKNSTQVEIARIETNLETSFIIKGQENAVKQAKQLMEKIAKDPIDNDRHSHQEKRNTICRYHKMGRCLRGDRCMYLHQEGPLDVSTSPTDYENTRDEWTPERHPNTWTSGNQQSHSRQHSPDRRHRERTPLGYRDRTPNTRPHTPEHRLRDNTPPGDRNRTPQRSRWQTPERRQRNHTPLEHRDERDQTPPRRQMSRTPRKTSQRSRQDNPHRHRSKTPHRRETSPTKNSRKHQSTRPSFRKRTPSPRSRTPTRREPTTRRPDSRTPPPQRTRTPPKHKDNRTRQRTPERYHDTKRTSKTTRHDRSRSHDRSRRYSPQERDPTNQHRKDSSRRKEQQYMPSSRTRTPERRHYQEHREHTERHRRNPNERHNKDRPGEEYRMFNTFKNLMKQIKDYE